MLCHPVASGIEVVFYSSTLLTLPSSRGVHFCAKAVDSCARGHGFSVAFQTFETILGALLRALLVTLDSSGLAAAMFGQEKVTFQFWDGARLKSIEHVPLEREGMLHFDDESQCCFD